MLGTNPKTGAYLGVYIAERVLAQYFDDTTRAPTNTPGFDFTCKRGFKIDVKSATSVTRDYGYGWSFVINRNKIADYFLCIAFDNIESLQPQKLWLIPGIDVNNYQRVGVSPTTFKKWEKYELPIDKVLKTCDLMRLKRDNKS